MSVDGSPGVREQVLEDLLLRCVERDEAAFAEYYRRTYSVLNALAKHRGWPRDTAQSVLVETYVRIWRQAGEFRRSGAGSAWEWTLTVLDHAVASAAPIPRGRPGDHRRAPGEG